MVIQAIPDSRQAFQEATELARILGEWSQQAARLRSAAAVRIAEDEQLSLAGLAEPAKRVQVASTAASRKRPSWQRRGQPWLNRWAGG